MADKLYTWKKVLEHFVDQRKAWVIFCLIPLLIIVIILYFLYGWKIEKELSVGLFTIKGPAEQEIISPSFDYKFSFYDLEGNLLPKDRVGVQLTNISKINFSLTLKNINKHPLEVRILSTKGMVGKMILNINSDDTLYRVESNSSETFSAFNMDASKLLKLLEEKNDLTISFTLPVEYRSIESNNFVTHRLGVVCRNALEHIPEVEWRKLPTFLPGCYFTSQD